MLLTKLPKRNETVEIDAAARPIEATASLGLHKIQNLIFGHFRLGKIRISAKNQNKNQNFLLTNTSINLGVMGISTLVLRSMYVCQ